MTRTVTSASNFFRRALCPGSHNAQTNSPESPDNPDSLRGTRLHWLDSQDSDGDGEQVSDAEFLRRNRELRDEFMAQQRRKFKIKDDEPCVTVKDNLEFWLKDESGTRLPIAGHPDCVYYYPRKKILFAFDLKTGRKPVPPAEVSHQLRCYLVQMADTEFGEYEVDIAICAITQPLCKPSLTACAFERDDIAKAKVELLNIYRNALLPDAPRYASYAACQHCSALATCGEGLALTKEIASTRISEIPIDQLEALIPKMELVEAVAKAFWTRVKLIAEKTPELLQHHELKPGAIVESVDPADTDNAGALLLTAAVISKDQFSECRKLSLTAVREHVAVNLGLKADEAKAKVAEILKPVLKTKQKAPTLVERKRVVMLENK